MPTDLFTFLRASPKSSAVSGTLTYSEIITSLTLEISHIFNILEASLLLELLSHRHVRSFSTDIGNVCPAVAFSLFDDALQIYILCYLDILQVNS